MNDIIKIFWESSGFFEKVCIISMIAIVAMVASLIMIVLGALAFFKIQELRRATEKQKEMEQYNKELERKNKAFELFNFVNISTNQDECIDSSRYVVRVVVHDDKISVTLSERGRFWTEQTFINRMNKILNNHKEATFIGIKLFQIFSNLSAEFTMSFKEFDHLYDLIILQKYEQPQNIPNSEMNLNFIKLQSDYLNLERKINSISDKLDRISVSRQNESNVINNGNL